MNPKLYRLSVWAIIVTAVGIGVVNLAAIQSRIDRLQASLRQQTDLRQQAETELARANSSLKLASDQLRLAQQSLETMASDKQSAVDEATAQNRRAAKLELTVAEITKQLNQKSDRLAQYEYSGLKPEEVTTMAGQFKKLRTQLDEQTDANRKLNAQIDEWRKLHPDITNIVILPVDFRGQVLAFDPKWRFIVINAGEEQGLRARGKLLVSRQGKLVGRAVVMRVDKDRAIANVLGESSEVLEGDSLLPADPRS